ncbi:MAG TPA: ABC transporter permease [Thermoanaerobaculia bacterium]|nr:ABC transporter permease [Thermoanaerobaculia bacterium]
MSRPARSRDERTLRRVAWLARPSLREEWLEEWRGELAATGEELDARRLAAAARDALLTHTLSKSYRRRPAPHHEGRTETVLQDLRYALRALRRSPAYATLAVLTVALGIAATTAIFSVVWGVVLAPLPFADADELTVVWGYHPQIGRETASAPDFLDWREQAASFARLAAYSRQNANLTGEGDPARLRGARMTAGFFELLGVRPALGRLPADQEDAPGAAPVALLAHSTFEERFGGDPGVVGRAVRLDGEPVTVIGVLPRGFELAEPVELWRPFAADLSELGRRSDFLRVLGRLRDGATIEQAQREMTTIMARLEEEYPQTNAGWTAEVVSLHEQTVGAVRPALLALLGAVVFVLLIACANVANLMLVRSARRRGELAVRSALGASGGRLASLMLLESLLVAALGGLVGLALAGVAVRLLVAFAPADLPRLDSVALDLPVVLFAAGVTALTGVLFGLLPALRVAGPAVQRFLRSGRSGGDRLQRRAGGALILVQTALAIVLLVGAGLMMRSLANLRAVELGFEPEGLAMGVVVLPESSYAEPAQRVAFFAALVERLSAMPGVERAAASSHEPLGGAGFLSFTVDGRPPLPDSVVQDAHLVRVTPGLIETLEIPLLRGRTIQAGDQAESERVALIDQRMVERYFEDEEPLGARVTFDGANFATIVGVVGSVRQDGLAEAPYPTVYAPHAQAPVRAMALLVRTEGDPQAAFPNLREAVGELDADLPLTAVATFRQAVSEQLVRPRFLLGMLGVFAGAALLLAAVGLYGVLSISVAQRLREIALRIALGASGRDLVRSLVRSTVALVGAGALLGVAAALGLARVLGSLWYQVSPSDPWTIVAVVGVLLLVALLAMALPARRACRVEPMTILREE